MFSFYSCLLWKASHYRSNVSDLCGSMTPLQKQNGWWTKTNILMWKYLWFSSQWEIIFAFVQCLFVLLLKHLNSIKTVDLVWVFKTFEVWCNYQGGDKMCVYDLSSFKVCERSLSGTGAGPSTVAAPQFLRAEMLPSGYLIRPCEGGGSIIHIVDHLNLKVRCALNVIHKYFWWAELDW